MSFTPDEIILEVWSTIAAAASAVVFLTPVIFPSMRKQIFVQLISYAALCTFMTSLGTWFGFPDDGSMACTAQAVIISFFSKASWFWLTIISLELFSIFVYEKYFFTQPALYMNLAVWPLTLFLTFIPLSTTKFGRTADDKTDGWCFLTGNDTDSAITLWSIISIYLPFFICLVLMSGFAVYTRVKALTADSDGKLLRIWDPVYKLVNSMFLYPIFFITWFPFVILSIVNGYNGYADTGASAVAIDFGNILSTQLGTFVFLIFFWTSAEARFRWIWVLASPCYGSPKVNPYDDSFSATATLSEPLIGSEEGDRISSHDSDVFRDNWSGNRASRVTTVQNRFPLLYEFFGRFMLDTDIQYEVKDAVSPIKAKPLGTQF